MDNSQINEAVRSGLAHEWVPEQIARRRKQQDPDHLDRRVSPQTIYTWIENYERREHWKASLRRRAASH